MDRQVIEQKIEALRRCILRVREKCPATADGLHRDIDAQDIVSLNLTRAVQWCIDIGAHVLPAWRRRRRRPWARRSICWHRPG